MAPATFNAKSSFDSLTEMKLYLSNFSLEGISHERDDTSTYDSSHLGTLHSELLNALTKKLHQPFWGNGFPATTLLQCVNRFLWEPLRHQHRERSGAHQQNTVATSSHFSGHLALGAMSEILAHNIRQDGGDSITLRKGKHEQDI